MADKEVDEKLLRKYYMQAFGGEAGAMVLKDIENRCFKRDTTIPRSFEMSQQTLVNEGKRQVLLHIENMMSPRGIAKSDESPGGEGD